MNKDFLKFESDFYAEVKNTLPEFYKKVHKFQIVETQGCLEVLFCFTNVTGKDLAESICLFDVNDVKDAINKLNTILKVDYPFFAHFNDLKDVIKTAIEIDDETNNYQVCLKGDTDTALVYVKTHYDELGNLLFTVFSSKANYINNFTTKDTPEEIESTVCLDIFGELDEAF